MSGIGGEDGWFMTSWGWEEIDGQTWRRWRVRNPQDEIVGYLLAPPGKSEEAYLHAMYGFKGLEDR